MIEILVCPSRLHQNDPPKFDSKTLQLPKKNSAKKKQTFFFFVLRRQYGKTMISLSVTFHSQN